jgi:hypothetical protein
MHICKNDPKKFYKGDEPSPKGLGYCAHAESIGKVRKGKDGNIWKVESTSKGIKRWVVQIKKQEQEKSVKKSKRYYIHSGWDGDLGFTPINYLVCINKKKAIVYETPKDFYSKIIKNEDNKNFFEYSAKKIKYYHYFTKKILEFEFDKVFIPKGIKDALSFDEKSKINYDSNYNGNNILFKIKNDYIFIGNQIYKFSIGDDIINEFYSSVELYNYYYFPVAYGKKYAYMLLSQTFIPIEYFKYFTLKDKANPLLYIYVKSLKAKPPPKNEEKIKLKNKPLNKYSLPMNIIKKY